MNNETLDFRIQNIKAAIERETEGLTADEFKVVHAAVATAPSVPRCQHCGQEFNCEMPERVPLGTMCVDCFNSGHVGIGQQTTARRSAQNRRINCPKCIVSSSSSLAQRIAERIVNRFSEMGWVNTDRERDYGSAGLYITMVTMHLTHGQSKRRLRDHANDGGGKAAHFGRAGRASNGQVFRAVPCLSENNVATGELLCRASYHRRTSANKARAGNLPFSNSLLHQLWKHSFYQLADFRFGRSPNPRIAAENCAEHFTATDTNANSAKESIFARRVNSAEARQGITWTNRENSLRVLLNNNHRVACRLVVY